VGRGSDEADVSELREAIAAVDVAIAEQLERRLDLARALSGRKRESRIKPYAPEQEVVVQRRLREAAGAGVPLEAADAIARELISAGRRVQGTIGTAFVGEDFGPAWAASRQVFGASAHLRGIGSLEEALRLLGARELDYAITEICVPLLEAIAGSSLRISREVELLGTGRFVVLGEDIARPCGEDTTLVRLLGWKGRALDGSAPAPLRTAAIWRLGRGDLVVELPGHPETGSLQALAPLTGEMFSRCEVLGAWPSFQGEPLKP
jgi:chorismate mutase